MENRINCECGEEHCLRTDNIVVSEFAFDNLLESLKTEVKDKKLFVLSSDCSLVERLSRNLQTYLRNINFMTIDCPIPSLYQIKDIKLEEADVILALGSEEIISIAKYLSYMLDCKLIIFPVGNFCDWTFSKFARIFDGITFDFYLAKEPDEIYVSTTHNRYNELQTIYIASKYIAKIDNEVSETVYSKKHCKKCKKYLDNILKCYIINENNKQKSNIKNIWTLIRIGQAMSFFSQTKCFFGGDKAIVDLMQAQSKTSEFLELCIISQKLIINLYSCFYKNYPVNQEVNINRHIKELSELLKISVTEAMRRLVDNELLQGSEQIKSKFNNYYQLLKREFLKNRSKIFEIIAKTEVKTNSLKKHNFSRVRIERSFALASCLYSSPCTLHLFSMLGYLDKIL